MADGSPVGVELLFTTCEERALDGAKAVDPAPAAAPSTASCSTTPRRSASWSWPRPPTTGWRRASWGTPPTPGIRPEAGRNAIAAAARAIAAMPIGRLDPETTANVGLIEGGTAANVVAERCVVELEARSLDEARAAEVVQQHGGRGHRGRGLRANATWRPRWSASSAGYRLPRTAPAVEVAAAALRACGLEPSYIATGGGSDANVFVAAGLPVVNVANGTERNHQPDESVTVEALEQMLDVTLAIVAAGAG